MKTDSLFYELFRFDPRSLFRLVQLELRGEYVFESITTKTTEKRFDGFFRSLEGSEPDVFLEIQGYSDTKIYWRLFREICSYYEQSSEPRPFVAIVLFIDEKYDPGKPPLACVPPNQMIRTTLAECFETPEDKAGALTVLKPLIFPDEKELVRAVRQWKTEISTMRLPPDKHKTLTELLEYAILQRFPKLTLKEIQNMLELTPLNETFAGKELIQIGREEGREEGQAEGMEKGELIGEIRLAQRILRHPVSSSEKLALKEIDELRYMVQQLETELNLFRT